MGETPGRLLERDRELAAIDALVAAAGAGSGGLLVVEGVAGLGKTRLLQATRERAAAAGLRVLSARATELEREFAYGIARQLFEPALAALDAETRAALLAGAAAGAGSAIGLAPSGRDRPDDAATPDDAFAVLHGLYWLTAGLAERQPLLLCVDDAQWADSGSLDFLGFLATRLEGLPLVLAVACRPDETEPGGTLARLVADPDARRLAPSKLSADATAELLADELERVPDPDFAATCHRLSGGNPFLLHELARTLAVEAIEPRDDHAARLRELAPERVTRTVLLRLARTSPAAQALTRALLVLGDGADAVLAAALAGLDPDELSVGADELRAVAILDRDAALRFAHPLVRTALDSELRPGERERAHLRAVELLHARGADAQQVALHLLGVAPRGDRATVQTLLDAGRAALAGGAPASAAAYLRRALAEPPPADLRPATLQAIVAAGISAPDRELFESVMPVLADALDEARRATGRALAHARRRNVTPELVAAAWMSGFVSWAEGDLPAAEADLRQALEVAQLGALRFAELPVRAVLASLLVARGELDDAAVEVEASGAVGEIPDVVWFAPALFARAQLGFERGNFDRAAADWLQLERLSARWGVIGVPAPPPRIGAVHALAALGDRDRARPLADAALAHARRWGTPTLVSRALRAHALTLEGGERIAALAEAVSVLDGSPARLVRAEALVALGAELRRSRRRADARGPLREGLDLARRCGAVGLARTAFDELAATGERVRSYAPIGVESLTPSQRRVAELAAGGMTNREIAQALFLTVKTIESHLAAAYDKLGIRSRQDLPRVQGIAPAKVSEPVESSANR